MKHTHEHDPRPTAEEYAAVLEEVVSERSSDRRLEAVERAIEEEAESIRDFLEAANDRSLAEALLRAVQRADDLPSEAWGAAIADAAGERSKAAQERKRSLEAEAKEHLWRLRYLTELKHQLEESERGRT